MKKRKLSSTRMCLAITVLKSEDAFLILEVTIANTVALFKNQKKKRENIYTNFHNTSMNTVKDFFFFIQSTIWGETAQLLDKWGIFVNSLHIPYNTVLISQFSWNLPRKYIAQKVDYHFIKIPIWYHPVPMTGFPVPKVFTKSELHCNFLPKLTETTKWMEQWNM